MYAFVRGDPGVQALHINRSGRVTGTIAFEGIADARAFVYLNQPQRFVVLTNDRQRLYWFAGNRRTSASRAAAGGMHPCFTANLLGSDSRNRVLVGGMDGEPDGGRSFVLIFDGDGLSIDEVEIDPSDAPITGLVATRDTVLVTGRRGLLRFAATQVVPDGASALQCMVLTPALSAADRDDGRRWLRVDATAQLAAGAAIEIAFASTDDADVVARLGTIAADARARESRVSRRSRSEPDIWSDATVFHGSADWRRDRGSYSAKLFDVQEAVRLGLGEVDRVVGRGAAGPTQLDVLYPGLTLMQKLPAIYQRDEARPDSFLRNFVGVVEATTQDIDARVGSLGSKINPATAPIEWLDFVARWLGVPWDDGLSDAQKRAIVTRAPDLLKNARHARRHRAVSRLSAPTNAAAIPCHRRDGRFWVRDSRRRRKRAATELPALLGGATMWTTALDGTSRLGCMRLPCDGQQTDAALPFAGIVQVEVAASATERIAWKPWLRSLIEQMMPLTARLQFRWVGLDALRSDRLDGSFVLDVDARPDHRHRHSDQRRAPARARNPPLGLRLEPQYAFALTTGDGSMQEMDTTVTVKQPAPRPRKSASRVLPGRRVRHLRGSLKNNYYEGKRLTPDTFRVEQRYMVERRRLLNRAIHGWGVVYGYPVAVETRKQRKPTKQDRLRRDPCGRDDDEPREMRDAMSRRLKIDDGFALDAAGASCCTRLHDGLVGRSSRGQRPRPPPRSPRGVQDGRASPRGRARRARAGFSRRTTRSRASIPFRSPTRAAASRRMGPRCETVRFTLRRIPCEECCEEPACELDCRCTHGGCCHSERERLDIRRDETWREEVREEEREEQRERREMETTGHEPSRRPITRPSRGGCRCICDHLTRLHPGEGCTCGLCEIDEMCGSVRVDLAHGVPLACVEVVLDECDEWTFGPKVEVCGPRRFVKRNDLLFDLIQGCDLTRIAEIGWAEWHRREKPISHDEFLDALGFVAGELDPRDEYVARRFWVEFSRPVRRDSLRADCFAMTVLSREERELWWTPNRVPIVGVELWPSEPETPHLVRGAAIVVDGVWLYDAVRSSASVFHDHVTRVEFEIRGDFIVDCNGQTVDGEAIGHSPPPTGNRSPGGTFLSTFRVARSEHSDRRDRPDHAARSQGVSR